MSRELYNGPEPCPCCGKRGARVIAKSLCFDCLELVRDGKKYRERLAEILKDEDEPTQFDVPGMPSRRLPSGTEWGRLAECALSRIARQHSSGLPHHLRGSVPSLEDQGLVLRYRPMDHVGPKWLALALQDLGKAVVGLAEDSERFGRMVGGNALANLASGDSTLETFNRQTIGEQK